MIDRTDAMTEYRASELFDLTGRVAAVTGGAGVLCAEMARCLAANGVAVAVLDIDAARGSKVIDQICAAGGKATFVETNVLEKPSVEDAAKRVADIYGCADILINGAGGNKPDATTSDELPFFEIPAEAFRWVLDLNCIGTVLPSQAFARPMAEAGRGVILNVSSMNALRPLTKIPAYSAAKAAVSNFTQWLAVHMARNYSPNIRVNALAPGFFLTQQNRFLLVDDKSGELTQRGRTIVDHTPMQRFGEPADLLGTLLWIISPAAQFVTGTVIPVDGGFNAFSGV